jgi:Cu(I)/Ag(I) efflux system membrane fusion protein/cobalt-zinc-cadmium efflux system membrane fusion protein
MHGGTPEQSGWMVQAAEERLRQFGMSADEIAELESSNKVQRDITVDSPVSGYITERNALPNAYVQPEMKLYTIADLSSVWAYANVAQSDIGRVRPGNPGVVTVDSYPGRKFNARVDQILPQVDQTTRTVKVRLVLSNPGVALKPGMYVNVDLDCPLGRQLVVPSSAVLQAGARTIAFVDHGGGSLEPREIETGPTVDDSVVILKGLKAGEKVVSSANFLLDSEAQLQSSFGGPAPAGQQPAAYAGAAKADSAAENLQIDFSTDPSPPRKGDNTLHVKVTGAGGKPVAGVQVNAGFFMAAMPAMGMAAEHAQATLEDKGNGQYEGQVQLDAGGTWAVTVVVQRGGQTVATRRTSVSATGGM